MKEANLKRLHTMWFPTIWYSGKGKTMETIRSAVARSWDWGCGEGWIGREQRNFRAVKILCVIPQWCIHVIIYLSKPTEYKTPRVNPKVNYGLWVIMCQCRFILDIKKSTILVSDVDNIGGYACVEAYGKTLYLPLNFVVNLKLL